MKFLGIDYGTKRIGFAISDENHTFAFPKEIILNDKNTLNKLRDIIKKEKIENIVIGESLDLVNKPNIVSNKIDDFISLLKQEFKLEIHKEKEFLTSIEARKMGNTKTNLHQTEASSKIKKKVDKKVDAIAAALILQRFLDKHNNLN